MGKKKASRTGSEFDDDHASSVASLCGRSSTGAEWELDGGGEPDEFAASIEKLYEKRASTREEGLRKLISLTTSQHQLEECLFKQETLAQMLLASLRKGGPEECSLAARCLGLHVITLGASDASERIFHDALSMLEPLILTGRSPGTRAAAIHALSMMCFVGGEGPHEALQVMRLLARAYSGGQPLVQAAALRGWALLLSTVPAWQLGGTAFVEEHLKLLAALLRSEDVEVRAAAGEAVALLFDVCDLGSLPESAVAEDSEPRRSGSGKEEGMPERLEDIVSRMQDLAKNRGDETRRSKKDRASLRGTFRELCSIVEDGASPEQKVRLQHGDVLLVDTLAGNIQLNAFRAILGEGFQVHLQQNSLLHEVFNHRPRAEQAERLTPKEKRMLRSPASAESKGRSQLRKQERQMMSAYKAGMMY